MTPHGLEGDLDDLSQSLLGDLSPNERIRRIMEAYAEGREGLVDRLWETTPRKTYSMPDAAVAEAWDKTLLIAYHALACFLDTGLASMATHREARKAKLLADAVARDQVTPDMKYEVDALLDTYEEPGIEDVVGCPSCGVPPTEACQTKNGKTTNPHEPRLDHAPWGAEADAIDRVAVGIAVGAANLATRFLAWYDAYERFAKSQFGVDLETWFEGSLGPASYPLLVRVQLVMDFMEGGFVDDELAGDYAGLVREQGRDEGMDPHDDWTHRPVETARWWLSPVAVAPWTPVEGDILTRPEAADLFYEKLEKRFANHLPSPS